MKLAARVPISVICAAAILISVSRPFQDALASSLLEIRLHTEAEVEDSSIRLGQIAEIKGGDAEHRRSLAELELGPSPMPGRSLWIHQGQIRSRLIAEEILPDAFVIAADGPVKVLRSYEDLTAKKLCDAVKAYIYQTAPWERDQIRIRSVTYSQSHRLPPGKLELKIREPKHTDWIGAIPFYVEVYVDGRIFQKMSVPAHIEVWSDIVVAAKPLGRGQPIGHADIKIQRMNLSRVPKNAILRPDQVIGYKAVRAVAVNAILSTDQIELPPVIKKGDKVQVVAQTPLLKVTIMAIAKENGGIGENIRVVNLSSNKIIFAQVVDPSTVRVVF